MTVTAAKPNDVEKREDLVTLTIGGNDLGFGTGINTCLTGTDADCQKVVDDAKGRGADWDAVVGVSGGKDSHWQVLTCLEYGLKPLAGLVLGVLWAAVASVRSGRRTSRPARRRPSKACGLVTSWTRCRSM